MEVKCEKLDNFGKGITYIDNKITFIPDFLPSETADIKITKNKKKYADGVIDKLITKSKDRINPKCPYNSCGCSLKCLNYNKQLEYKNKKVEDILLKYSNIKPKINNIVESKNIYNYRNKVTLKALNKVGYCKNKSREIIEIDRCELASEKINSIIAILNHEDLTKVKEITIKDFDETMVSITGNLDITRLKEKADIIFINNKLVHGHEFTTTTIDNLTFKVSKDSFFQVNKFLLSKLYNQVIEYAGKDKNKKVLDLYCGTGTITLLLSKYFKNVVGIEINKEAIICANENKKINKIKNVSFICGDVSKNIHNLNSDIIVVDPPRSGLSEKTIIDILKINPEKIIYVSCDVITLARDLKVLNNNYDVVEVSPYDMFPHTYHVECVSLLCRKNLEK